MSDLSKTPTVLRDKKVEISEKNLGKKKTENKDSSGSGTISSGFSFSGNMPQEKSESTKKKRKRDIEKISINKTQKKFKLDVTHKAYENVHNVKSPPSRLDQIVKKLERLTLRIKSESTASRSPPTKRKVNSQSSLKKSSPFDFRAIAKELEKIALELIGSQGWINGRQTG